MKTNNLSALLIVVALIVGTIVYLDRGKTAPAGSSPAVEVVKQPVDANFPLSIDNQGYAPDIEKKKRTFERAKEITAPDGFINSPNPKGAAEPLTLGELVGKKVILLDIWTYSCINCQRTFPYLQSWYAKYKDKGLEIIGLHVPEFEFEKKYENVLAAVKKFGITYPVVLDSHGYTARAYGMRYWPEEYLIDIDGFIVHKSVGEGGYEETEREIQKLLAERMERLGEKGVVGMPVTEEKPVPRAESPEVYFGASRNEYLANGDKGKIGAQTFTMSEEPKRNRLYLGGNWDIQNEYAENIKAGATIEFKYKSKEVYFVASSPNGITVKIYNDGVLVRGLGGSPERISSAEGTRAGEDVGADGTVFIKEDRLYKLIQNSDIGEHVLKIEIESPGLKAFTFTFG